MLNPELVEYYGEECIPFFSELIKRVEGSLIDKCYAIKGSKVISGELCGPQFIGVVSDRGSMRKVEDHCLDINIMLKDREDDRDSGILAIVRSEESVRKDGIKVWL